MTTTRNLDQQNYKIFQNSIAILVGAKTGNAESANNNLPSVTTDVIPLFQGIVSLPSYVKSAHLHNILKYVFSNDELVFSQYKKLFSAKFFDRLLYIDKGKKNTRATLKRRERAFDRLNEIFGNSPQFLELSTLQKEIYHHLIKRAQEEERHENQNKTQKSHSHYARNLLRHVQDIFAKKYAGVNDDPMNVSTFSDVRDREQLESVVSDGALQPNLGGSRQTTQLDTLLVSEKSKVLERISTAGFIKYIRLQQSDQGQVLLKKFQPGTYIKPLMLTIRPLLCAELPSYVTQKDMQDLVAFQGYTFANNFMSTEPSPFILDRLVKGDPDDRFSLDRCFVFISHETSEWITQKEIENEKSEAEEARKKAALSAETKEEQLARERWQLENIEQTRQNLKKGFKDSAFNLQDDILKAKVLRYMLGAELLKFYNSLPLDDERRLHLEKGGRQVKLIRNLSIWYDDLKFQDSQIKTLNPSALFLRDVLQKYPLFNLDQNREATLALDISSSELKKFVNKFVSLEQHGILNELDEKIIRELNQIVDKGVENYRAGIDNTKNTATAITNLKNELKIVLHRIGISNFSDSELQKLTKNVAEQEFYRRALNPFIVKFLPKDIHISGINGLFNFGKINTFAKIQEINNFLVNMNNQYAEPSLTQEKLPAYFDKCAIQLRELLRQINIHFELKEIREKILPTIVMDFDRKMLAKKSEPLDQQDEENELDFTSDEQDDVASVSEAVSHYTDYLSIPRISPVLSQAMSDDVSDVTSESDEQDDVASVWEAVSHYTDYLSVPRISPVLSQAMSDDVSEVTREEESIDSDSFAFDIHSHLDESENISRVSSNLSDVSSTESLHIVVNDDSNLNLGNNEEKSTEHAARFYGHWNRSISPSPFGMYNRSGSWASNMHDLPKPSPRRDSVSSSIDADENPQLQVRRNPF